MSGRLLFPLVFGIDRDYRQRDVIAATSIRVVIEPAGQCCCNLDQTMLMDAFPHALCECVQLGLVGEGIHQSVCAQQNQTSF